MPRVSVLIPCYNGAKYLTQALRSVTGQTYRDMEIIAVDNGSTDATADIIRAEARLDKRILYIEEKRKGI
jgi:glycosyltransferase involved in cell wall biosynthesis